MSNNSFRSSSSAAHQATTPAVVDGLHSARPNMYLRMLAYLRPYRGTFILALICMVLFGATDGIVPYLIKQVLDGVFQSHDTRLLKLIPVALVGFAFVRALLDFAQQYLMGKIGHLVVRDLRNEVNERLLSFSPDYFVRQQSADLLSRITSDVLLLRVMLTESLAAVIRDLIRVVALLVAAVALDPMLALISVVVFPLGIYPVYRFSRRMRKLSRQGQEAIGSLSSLMQETIIGNKIVRIFTREEFERQRFIEENDKLTATFVKSEKVRALTGPVNEVLATCAIAGVILYGGYSVIGGIRSQGEFIAFLLAVFLLYDPFKKLSRVSGSVQQAAAGAERVFEIIDAHASIVDPEQPQSLVGGYEVRFEDVSFTHSGNDVFTLQGIDLTFEHGKKVAIVGFSGAGKSTLVDLIPRFMDPTRGRITVGDVDISQVRLKDLRSQIAYVGQHTFLFHDTIYQNIAYGREGATREEVVQAAQAAYAHEFIEKLPHGYDTHIGEAGLRLSGGERQRIAIARALLKNAPILILDEATASLDNRSEREVQLALDQLEKGRTTIVIAHRLSTVRNADRIVVLREGRVVEVGTHDELLQRADGEYLKLYNLQFAPAAQEGEFDEALLN